MNDLATRLRALADRIESAAAVDVSHLPPALIELTDEILRQRIDDLEEDVDVLVGNMKAERGVLRMLREAIETVAA